MHDKQKSILKLIKKNPQITVRELQNLCNISSSSVVQHHLLVLQKDGLIKKVNKWQYIPYFQNGKCQDLELVQRVADGITEALTAKNPKFKATGILDATNSVINIIFNHIEGGS